MIENGIRENEKREKDRRRERKCVFVCLLPRVRLCLYVMCVRPCGACILCV